METPTALTMRQVSGNPDEERGSCKLCLDLIKCTPGHLRLGCRCLIHLTCLTCYIKSEIANTSNEFSIRQSKGFCCPFYSSSSIANECQHDGRYILGADAFESLVAATETSSFDTNSDDALKLTSKEVEIARLWLDGTVIRLDTEILVDPFLQATTKRCPNPLCPATVEHFHRHKCHHVTCGACKTEMCFSCLATAEENSAQRGTRSRCKCPTASWSSSCKPFSSIEDFESYLGRNEYGYPIDTRCGCPICPTCRPVKRCGKKSCTFKGNADRRTQRCLDCAFDCLTCEYAGGDKCSPCLGHMNPGPSDMATLSEWVPQTEEQKALLVARLTRPEQSAATEVLVILRTVRGRCSASTRHRHILDLVEKLVRVIEENYDTAATPGAGGARGGEAVAESAAVATTAGIEEARRGGGVGEGASLEISADTPLFAAQGGGSAAVQAPAPAASVAEAEVVPPTPAQSIRLAMLEQELERLLVSIGGVASSADTTRVNELVDQINIEQQRRFLTEDAFGQADGLADGPLSVFHRQLGRGRMGRGRMGRGRMGRGGAEPRAIRRPLPAIAEFHRQLSAIDLQGEPFPARDLHEELRRYVSFLDGLRFFDMDQAEPPHPRFRVDEDDDDDDGGGILRDPRWNRGPPPYRGLDLDGWISHFRLECARPFLEEIGVTDLDDLRLLADDLDFHQEGRQALNRLCRVRLSRALHSSFA